MRVVRVGGEEPPGNAGITSLALRPVAGEYEAQLPRAFRFLTRGWGTRETSSPDLLSLLMFEPAYLRRLIEIGEADAEARFDEILALLRPPAGDHRMAPARRARPSAREALRSGTAAIRSRLDEPAGLAPPR